MTQCDWMIGICWYIISFSKWNYYSEPIHTNNTKAYRRASKREFVPDKILTITASRNASSCTEQKPRALATSHLSIRIGNHNCFNCKSFTIPRKVLYKVRSRALRKVLCKLYLMVQVLEIKLFLFWRKILAIWTQAGGWHTDKSGAFFSWERGRSRAVQ